MVGFGVGGVAHPKFPAAIQFGARIGKGLLSLKPGGGWGCP